MAIQTLSFISLILRPDVEQPISTDDCKSLFSWADSYRKLEEAL